MYDRMEKITTQMLHLKMHNMLQNEKPNVNHHNNSNCNTDNVSHISTTDFNSLLSPQSHKHSCSSIDCDNSPEYRHPNDRIPTTPMTDVADVKNPTSRKRKRENDFQIMQTSTPYRDVNALCLYNSPATPRIKKSTMRTPLSSRTYNRSSLERLKSCNDQHTKFKTNVNPFTPENMLRVRSRSKRSFNSLLDIETSQLYLTNSEDFDEIESARKNITLEDTNISRFHREFHKLDLLSTNKLSLVYKCINRLDGYMYTVKTSIRPIKDSIDENDALKEVYAHAVLGKHQNVVRYYSAWTENNRVIIQNEYCNGGSLTDMIVRMQKQKKYLSEPRICQLLLHVAEGLKYIHSMQLVHMNIKPSNIFISNEKLLGSDYNFDDDFDVKESVEDIIYKIGDFGHVTSISNPQVEEGDYSYLSAEILRKDFTQLPKADIFALGLTIYEVGGGGPLPKNGPAWQEIREGNLKSMPHYSFNLNDLLKLMIHPDPETRPSAMSLIVQVLSLHEDDTEAQLQRKLYAEKMKNEMLSKQLEQAAKYLRTNAINVAVNNTLNTKNYTFRPTSVSSRIVGKTVNRSKTINF